MSAWLRSGRGACWMSESEIVVTIVTICAIWVAYCCLEVFTGDRRR